MIIHFVITFLQSSFLFHFFTCCVNHRSHQQAAIHGSFYRDRHEQRYRDSFTAILTILFSIRDRTNTSHAHQRVSQFHHHFKPQPHQLRSKTPSVKILQPLSGLPESGSSFQWLRTTYPYPFSRAAVRRYPRRSSALVWNFELRGGESLT